MRARVLVCAYSFVRVCKILMHVTASVCVCVCVRARACGVCIFSYMHVSAYVRVGVFARVHACR